MDKNLRMAFVDTCWLTQRGSLVTLLVGGLFPIAQATAATPSTPSLVPQSIAQSVAQVDQSSARATVRLGSQGIEVRELQAALKLLGYYDGAVDGLFGEETGLAVRRFQQAAGIEADGVVGPATWSRLFPPAQASAPDTATRPAQPPDRPTTAGPVDLPVLRMGMRGPAVVRLQERLQAKGFLQGPVDGVFGSETKAAVQAAQRNYQLDPDGVVGPATWSALLR